MSCCIICLLVVCGVACPKLCACTSRCKQAEVLTYHIYIGKKYSTYSFQVSAPSRTSAPEPSFAAGSRLRGTEVLLCQAPAMRRTQAPQGLTPSARAWRTKGDVRDKGLQADFMGWLRAEITSLSSSAVACLYTSGPLSEPPCGTFPGLGLVGQPEVDESCDASIQNSL